MANDRAFASRPVGKYCACGKEEKRYNSVTDAADGEYVCISSMTDRIRSGGYYGGFRYAYLDNPPPVMSRQPVEKVDSKGNVVALFKCLADAAQDAGKRTETMRYTVKRGSVVNGYTYRVKEGEDA